MQNVQVLNKKTGVYEPINPNKTYTSAASTTPSPTAATASRCSRTPALKAGDATMTDAQTVLPYIETKLGGTIGEQYLKPRWPYFHREVHDVVLASGMRRLSTKSATTAFMNGVGTGFNPDGALTRGMLS